MLIYQILAFTIHGKNIKNSYKNNKFKTSAPTLNEDLPHGVKLPHGSYSVYDLQDYFEHIIKTHETVTDNPLIMIYVNKIEK